MLIEEGYKQQDTNLLKSSFLLTEAMFSLNEMDLNQMAVKGCITKLFQVISQIMIQLNTDIMNLNNILKQD